MSIPPFQYPLIGFGRPHPPFDRGEDLHGFREPDRFTVCGPWTVQYNAAVGILLVDSAGDAWEVVEAIYRERKRNLWQRMFKFNWFDMTLKFEPRPALSLSELKGRVCESLRAEPERWQDDEASAGETGAPVALDAQIDALTSKVQSAGSLTEILDLLALGDRLQ